MKKILTVLIAVFSISCVLGQSSVNGYKYVIVPKKFDFLKKENQYQVNALVKFLFEKYDFTAVYANELNADIEENSCLALKADVRDDSNMFTTKLKVELTNCRGEVVFLSEEGKSKEKDYKKAYHDALRKAFLSVEELGYRYDPSQAIVAPRRSVAAAPAATATPVLAAESKAPDNTPVPVARQTGTVSGEVLYAQPVENGYQLVDQSPKVVFVLQNTSVDNVFIIKDKNGMLTLKDGKWMAEYYENGERVLRELEIKF
ncbi:hypothetical protein DN748_07060 [Sinomicrobium soli]|nr:hypothetical protein DN748_07060 [Sinomicrobium sp. N-1-3-6]